MGVALYMDVHVPHAITEQLRLRGVDVLAATEEGTNRLSDDWKRRRPCPASCLLTTIAFRAMAEQWQREGRSFAGLAFGSAEGASIGQYIRDLEIIAKVSEPQEWQNKIMYLPI